MTQIIIISVQVLDNWTKMFHLISLVLLNLLLLYLYLIYFSYFCEVMFSSGTSDRETFIMCYINKIKCYFCCSRLC